MKNEPEITIQDILPDALFESTLQACVTSMIQMLDQEHLLAMPSAVVILTVTPQGALIPEYDTLAQDARTYLFAKGRALAQKRHLPVGIWLCAEAWLAHDRPDDPAYNQLAPSKRPDRIETLRVGGLTVDGRTASVIFKTVRAPDGTIIVGPEIGRSAVKQIANVLAEEALLAQLFSGASSGIYTSTLRNKSKRVV